VLPDTLHAEFRSSVSHGSIKFNSVALCVCTNAGLSRRMIRPVVVGCVAREIFCTERHVPLLCHDASLAVSSSRRCSAPRMQMNQSAACFLH
jgi:hypothetical protein